MKVSELEGEQLDYWVGKAEDAYDPDGSWFKPSTCWEEGGPIIERERIRLNPFWLDGNYWQARIARPEASYDGFGKTALEAAMRAYVRSKFGDEVPDNG